MLAVGEAVDGRRDGLELADDGGAAAPVPMRVPVAQEPPVRVRLEEVGGVLVIDLGEADDVGVLGLDVLAQAKLRACRGESVDRQRGGGARGATTSESAGSPRGGKGERTCHFSALQLTRPATFQVEIWMVPLGSRWKRSGLPGRTSSRARFEDRPSDGAGELVRLRGGAGMARRGGLLRRGEPDGGGSGARRSEVAGVAADVRPGQVRSE